VRLAHIAISGALALIAAFMAGEVVVGLIAGSLALLSDAAHMLTTRYRSHWRCWRRAWPRRRPRAA
jgi:hypothetical protein